MGGRSKTNAHATRRVADDSSKVLVVRLPTARRGQRLALLFAVLYLLIRWARPPLHKEIHTGQKKHGGCRQSLAAVSGGIEERTQGLMERMGPYRRGLWVRALVSASRSSKTHAHLKITNFAFGIRLTLKINDSQIAVLLCVPGQSLFY